MSKWKTFFNPAWLQETEFKSWIEKDENNLLRARCRVCCTHIELSNMGLQALRSHAKGKKHRDKLAARVHVESPKLTSFWAASPKGGTSAVGTISGVVSQEKVSNSSASDIPPSITVVTATTTATTTCTTSSSMTLPPPPQPPQPQRLGTISRYMSSDAVLSAEINWAIKCITSHYSCHSSSGTDKLFRTMFPDSQIAQQFQCGPTKVMYLICYGLAPYFRDRLFSKLGPDTPYVVSFDESLNRIIQEEQMDLLVRFYDEERQMVVTRYLGSQFMGHTRAPDLLDKFMEGLEKLPAKNILQVSMDGPNVNKKFLESLTASRKSEHLPALLDIGSCPLHVVHGGFKFGAQKTGWQLDCLLRSMFYCFSDSPARREDYCKITGSEKFPLPFCATRWLEDAPVAERALELLPDVMKYVTETVRTKKKSQLPTASSFKTLQKFSEDKLLEAKLHFFVYVAKLTRKFLQVYQSDKPLVPFLAHDLESLIRSVLHKFVKHEVLSQAKTPSKVTTIDVYKKDNLLSYKEVELGLLLTWPFRRRKESPICRWCSLGSNVSSSTKVWPLSWLIEAHWSSLLSIKWSALIHSIWFREATRPGRSLWKSSVDSLTWGGTLLNSVTLSSRNTSLWSICWRTITTKNANVTTMRKLAWMSSSVAFSKTIKQNMTMSGLQWKNCWFCPMVRAQLRGVSLSISRPLELIWAEIIYSHTVWYKMAWETWEAKMLQSPVTWLLHAGVPGRGINSTWTASPKKPIVNVWNKRKESRQAMIWSQKRKNGSDWTQLWISW